MPDPANHPLGEFKVIEESGHSLVWMLNNGDADISEFKGQVLALGCRMEGLLQFSLHAIDVPPAVDRAQLTALIDAAEMRGLDFAFPVWRHDSEAN